MIFQKTFNPAEKNNVFCSLMFPNIPEKLLKTIVSVFTYIENDDSKVIKFGSDFISIFPDHNREYIRKSLILLSDRCIIVKEKQTSIFTKSFYFFKCYKSIDTLKIFIAENNQDVTYQCNDKLSSSLIYLNKNLFLSHLAKPYFVNFQLIEKNIISLILFFINTDNNSYHQTYLNKELNFPYITLRQLYNSPIFDKIKGTLKQEYYTLFKNTNSILYEFK